MSLPRNDDEILQESAFVDLPPTGEDMFAFEPTENPAMASLLLLRQQQIIERRRFNKILDEELQETRLEDNSWCSCSSGGSQSSKNCTPAHRQPKAAFCCHEAASKENFYGSNYQKMLGQRNCICDHENFFRRALDEENIKGWADLLRSRQETVVRQWSIGIYENRELRFAAYKSVTLWLHGPLGKGERIPLSSCIVNAIRQAYPEISEDYTDYQSEVGDDYEEDFDEE